MLREQAGTGRHHLVGLRLLVRGPFFSSLTGDSGEPLLGVRFHELSQVPDVFGVILLQFASPHLKQSRNRAKVGEHADQCRSDRFNLALATVAPIQLHRSSFSEAFLPPSTGEKT